MDNYSYCKVVCPRGTFFVYISASFGRNRMTRTGGWKDIWRLYIYGLSSIIRGSDGCFSHKNPVRNSLSLIRATCPDRRNGHELNISTVIGELYKLRNIWLCTTRTDILPPYRMFSPNWGSRPHSVVQGVTYSKAGHRALKKLFNL
jgi:hypothetical protein